MRLTIAPVTRTRVMVALAFSAITAVYATARALHEPNWPTDFDQLWHAAIALRGGDDAYAVVGPGRSFPWLWPLYYPLPAVLFAVPLTLLPVLAARIVFSAVAAAMLGWAVGPRVRTHWPMLLSASFIISTSRTQWAPMLLAAAWVPALGFVITAKPNVGLAALAAQDRRGMVTVGVGCLAALMLCFVVEPDWIFKWRDAIRAAPHIQAAVTVLPAGPLLALAALRWRRPDARLLLALAVIPHTPSLYDLLLLFYACRTLRETMALALLTQSLYWGIVLFGSFSTFDAYAEGLGQAAVLVVYIPVLIAVLLRPNVAADPAPESAVVAASRRATIVPTNWFDALLLSLLLITGTLLVWLPLVTYR
jgi:hypothetical protein